MDSWSADYREGDSSLPLSGQPPSHSGPLTRDFSQSQAQTSSCPEGSSLSKVRVNMGGFGKHQKGCGSLVLRAGGSTISFHLLSPWMSAHLVPNPLRARAAVPAA